VIEIGYMSELELAQKMKSLKVGQQFMVKEKRERNAAIRVYNTLKNAGYISFQITTRQCDEGFKVVAI